VSLQGYTPGLAGTHACRGSDNVLTSDFRGTSRARLRMTRSQSHNIFQLLLEQELGRNRTRMRSLSLSLEVCAKLLKPGDQQNFGNRRVLFSENAGWHCGCWSWCRDRAGSCVDYLFRFQVENLIFAGPKREKLLDARFCDTQFRRPFQPERCFLAFPSNDVITATCIHLAPQ